MATTEPVSPDERIDLEAVSRATVLYSPLRLAGAGGLGRVDIHVVEMNAPPLTSV
jgi:hypothetical protein